MTTGPPETEVRSPLRPAEEQLLAEYLASCGATLLTLEEIAAGLSATTVRGWVRPACAAQGPETFVAKAPPRSVAGRTVGWGGGIFARELGFYRDLARRCGTAVPAALSVRGGAEERRFLLVLEDLGPSRWPGPTVSPDDAGAMLDAVAGLHHEGWSSLAGRTWPWLRQVLGPSGAPRLDQRTIDHFVATYGAHLAGTTVTALDELRRWCGADWPMPARAATLVHGDLRPANVVAGDLGVVLIDWQSIGTGPASMDVASVLASALEPAVRRDAEPELLERYRRRLDALGSSWPAAEMARDHCFGAVVALAEVVVAGTALAPHPRSTEAFVGLTDRHAAQVLDLDCDRLFRPRPG